MLYMESFALDLRPSLAFKQIILAMKPGAKETRIWSCTHVQRDGLGRLRSLLVYEAHVTENVKAVFPKDI